MALAMFGGMSAGEISGLQWEHVNFVEGLIWVQHSLSRFGGIEGTKGPVTPSRYPDVPGNE